MLNVLLALFIVLCAALPAQAAVISTVEWESKPGSPWSYTAGRPNIDCTVPASPSGGCALRFEYAAGTYSTSMSGGRAEIDFGTNYSELWIGHWNRYSSNFVWNDNGTKMDMLFNGDKGTALLSGNMASGWKGSSSTPRQAISNQILWAHQGAAYSTADFWSPYIAVKNTWYWVEHHFVQNTPGVADGIYELWVNDTLQYRVTTVPYRHSSQSGTAWRIFQHTAEWGGGGGTIPATQYWWVDHTVFSTTRIGRPMSTSTGDTTAPRSPTLVRIE